MADAKSVKVERGALLNILSWDQTAYCLQIDWSILSTNVTQLLRSTANFVSSSEIFNYSFYKP